MYLIRIDPKTGLIDEDITNTGWKAIKVFRDLVDKKGIQALTVVALSVDYLSIFSNYAAVDRPARAMDEIYGNRTAIKTDDKLYVAAVEKYSELQFNPDLQQIEIFNDIHVRLLRKLNDFNKEENDTEIERFNRLLQKHNENVNNFKKTFNKEEALKMAVTSNGYELSRIENDILSRKESKFTKHGKDLKNPKKLGLEE